MYWFFPGKMLQCISALHTLGTLKNMVCHVWWALQYLALWATNRNYLYAPTPNGQSPSASLNKSNTPLTLNKGCISVKLAPVPVSQ